MSNLNTKKIAPKILSDDIQYRSPLDNNLMTVASVDVGGGDDNDPLA